MASAGARAYNGGLGRSPQRDPGAEPLVRGSGGEAPLKLKSFLLLDDHWKRQICPYSPCIADSVNHLNFHDLTWHQNDLKGQNHLFRVLCSVLRNKIVRGFSIQFLQACGPMKLVNSLDISIATYKSLPLFK